MSLQVALERIEADFWDIVERGEDLVEVLYGADLDTSALGSGFPQAADTAPAPCAPAKAASKAQGSRASSSSRAGTAAASTRAPLTEEERAYAHAPWNLNNLPRHAGQHSSLLRNLDAEVAGVVVPWMYIGMLFSSFCWHLEDHMLYSGACCPLCMHAMHVACGIG